MRRPFLLAVNMIAMAIAPAPAFAQSNGEAALFSIFGDPRVDAPVVALRTSDEVTAPGDIAVFSVNVTSDADSAEEALRANSAIAQRVLAALSAQGVTEAEFKPSSVSVFQRRGGRANSVRGYTANLPIRVETRNVGRASIMIAAAVQAGGQAADGPRYRISDTEPLLSPMRATLYARALAQAQDYARAAGYSRVRPVSIQEQSHSTGDTAEDIYAAISLAEEAADAAATAASPADFATPVPSIDVTVGLRLAISFRLER